MNMHTPHDALLPQRRSDLFKHERALQAQRSFDLAEPTSPADHSGDVPSLLHEAPSLLHEREKSAGGDAVLLQPSPLAITPAADKLASVKRLGSGRNINSSRLSGLLQPLNAPAPLLRHVAEAAVQISPDPPFRSAPPTGGAVTVHVAPFAGFG